MPDGTPPPPTPAGEILGRTLNRRYRVTRFIAGGGMAQVWEADDDVLARTVAVKVLRPVLAADSQFVARFRAEAIAAARLSHPAIVSIYDTFSDDGLEAIVMELVRGTTLRGLLDRRGRLAVADAIAIAGHVADALVAAHRAGLIHRDVKPANVLLSDDGRVLVTDFGIAKATATADITSESVLLGTAKYLAPEQVEGARVDARSDVYALGVVLYEMLCGQAPFTGETDAATALARLHRDPTPPRALRPDLPAAVAAVVDRALARDPDHRYRTAQDLYRALLDARRAPAPDLPPGPPGVTTAPLPVGAPLPVDAPPPASAPADERGGRPRRRLAVPVAMAALVVVAVAVVAMLLGRDRPSGRLPRVLVPGQEAVAVEITGATAFDPDGEPPGEESNELAPLAVDGDPGTAWPTERYRDPAIRMKPGVGIYVTLERTAALGRLIVESPTSGWAASVYLVDGEPGPDLASWGAPLATDVDLEAGTNRFGLSGRRGDAVLLWITRTGADGRVEVAELAVDALT